MVSNREVQAGAIAPMRVAACSGAVRPTRAEEARLRQPIPSQRTPAPVGQQNAASQTQVSRFVTPSCCKEEREMQARWRGR